MAFDPKTDIDPDAMYTTGAAIEMLMMLKPKLSFDEARRMVGTAIESGELPVAGYLGSKGT